MTLDSINAAKISQRQKSAVLGIALEAILNGGDVDVQDMFRRYTAWSDHPVSMTKFGREVKAMGVGYQSTNVGMKYYFNK